MKRVLEHQDFASVFVSNETNNFHQIESVGHGNVTKLKWVEI